MTNEEIIEEILIESSELRLREQVLELSKKLRSSNPKMTMLESLELAFQHYKTN